MTEIEDIVEEMRALNADITDIKGVIYKQYERLQNARLGLSKLETELEEMEEEN